MIKQSFTLRILVINFLVLAVPLLVDSFIFFQNSYYESVEDANTYLREAAHFRTFALAEIQPVKRVLLKELIYMLDLGQQLKDEDSEKLSHKLAEVAHVGGNFEIFILELGKSGRYKIIASSLQKYVGTVFTSFHKIPHFEKKGEGTLLRYVFSKQQHRFVPYVFLINLIQPSESEEPNGILMIAADIEQQLNTIISRGSTENISFAVLNGDGIVFDATDKTLIGNYLDPLSTGRRNEIIKLRQLGNYKIPLNPLPIIKTKNPPFFEFIFNDQVQIGYRAFLPNLGISVLAYSPKEEFFGKAIRHFLYIYSIYGLILIVGGGITYWLSLWVSRPLRQLTHLMGEVSQGNLDVRFVKQPLGFEINILGDIFNNTLITLLENIQRAEDERVKKETYQRELEIGRQVQKSLLPSKVPEVEGVEVAGIYIPAMEVGGDFYSYIQRDSKNDGEIMIIGIADAAGRGISSCLYALSARSLFRSYAMIIDDPGEILSQTNNAFLDDTGDTGMFISMFTGLYHTKSKIFSYYSCGHIPPIIRRLDGRLVTLEHSGMALGLKESEGYTSDSIQLQSGDLVIFYTDGLTEAVNEKHQYFSNDRLRRFLQQKKLTSAQETVEELEAELKAFTGNTPQEEEVIIVVLKVE